MRRHNQVFSLFFALLMTVVLLGFASGASAAVFGGYSEYYIPGHEAQMWYVFDDIARQTGETLNSGPGMHTVISITSPGEGSTIYYDHWEDGYEFDPNDPENTCDEKHVLAAGEVLRRESSNIPVPVRGTATYYDGGDRLYVAGTSAAVSRSSWTEDVGTVLAISWELLPVKPFLTDYTVPVGENLAGQYEDFERVYVLVQSVSDNNVVQIDNAGDGNVEVVTTLDRGDTAGYPVLPAAVPPAAATAESGTHVKGQSPVQVHFIAATYTHGRYEARGYNAMPDSMWDNEYINPVGSSLEADTNLYLYNPHSTAIIVNYADTTGNGSFTIAAGATKSYFDGTGENGGTSRFVPQNSGVDLSSDNIFWGIGAYDTESTTYDWGYSLVPKNFLTDEYFLSWAPGTSGTPAANGSPAFVTAVFDDTVVFVDYSPTDGTPDETVILNSLESRKFFDTADNDNTGMHIWATGSLAVAWGEDSGTATPYAPYLDLGTSNLPMPKNWIDLTLGILKSADPTVMAPVAGRITTFTLQAKTYDYDVLDIEVKDVLPPGFSFVSESARITLPDGTLILNAAANPAISGQTLTWGNAVWNNADPPLSKLDMAANKILTIQFDAVIDNTVTVATYSNTAQASGTRLVGSQVFSPFDNAAINVTAVTMDKDTSTPTVSAGGTASYTISVKNISDTDATNLSVTDTLPAGFSYDGGNDATIVFYDALGNVVSSTTATNDGSWGGGWTLGPGESVEITFTADIGANTPPDTYDSSASAQFDWGGTANTTIDDKGEVAQDLGTPHNEDPEDDEDVSVTSLLINKTTGTPTVVAGGTATYTIRLENSGGAAVTGVTVSDDLPAGFTFNSLGSITATNATRTLSTPNPAFGNTSLTWGTWTINAGGSIEIAFSVDVPDGTVPGTYDNSAMADSDQTGLIDDAGAVGGDTHTLSADTEADEDVTVQTAVLTIDKDAAFPYAAPGGEATYTISLANTGSATATDVAVTDSLAAGFTRLTSEDAVITFYDDLGQPFAPAFAVDPANDDGVWGGAWILEPGQSVSITFKTIAGPGAGTFDSNAGATAAGGISVDDIGTAGYDNHTPPLEDPETDEDITVLTSPMADLAVVKDHTDTGDFTLTGPNSYTITVTNNGPYTETNTITVTDTLPAGMIYASHNTGIWTLTTTLPSQTLAFEYTGSNLTPGDSVDLTLAVTVDENTISSPATNQVAVASATSDLIAGNDTATDETVVLFANLSGSTKTVLDVNGGDVEAGDTLRYTITIKESGGVAVSGIGVTDTIDADFDRTSFVLLPGDNPGDPLGTGGSSYVSGTGLLTLTGIDLDAYETKQIVFTVAVSSGAGQGTLMDNAAVITNPDGPNKTVNAPQLVVQASQVPAQGEKPLYLTTAQDLTRAVPGISTSNVSIADNTTQTWVLSPATTKTLVIDGTAGTIPVDLNIMDFFGSPYIEHEVTVTLGYAGASIGTIGSVSLSGRFADPETVRFDVPISGDHTLAAGTEIILSVHNRSQYYPFYNIALLVYPATTVGGQDAWSQVVLDADTVINVDSVAFYDDAYPAGSPITSVLPGTDVYVRAVVSDPFGTDDITGATLDLVDPEGTVVVDNGDMAEVSATGAYPKIFQYQTAIPHEGPVDFWTATVTAAEGSEGTVTDTGVATILVSSVIGADLAITKFHSDTFFENHTARFTLRVTNYGPQDQVAAVVVTDVLPAGLAYVSSTGADWTLTGNAADTLGAGQTTLEWTYGGPLPIDAGETLPVITLTVTTASGAPTSLENTAIVSPGQGTVDPENNLSNNSSTDTVYPVVQSVVKTVDSDIHYSGDNSDTLTYTVTVTNTGASEMTNVVVTDELPDGVSYVADSARVSGPKPVFRVTEYYVSSGFTGTSHTLVLDQDLADNYFVMVQGSDGDGDDRGPDENYISLTADPFATGDLGYSGGSNRLGFIRHHNENGWRGVITVVESLSDHEGSGFILRNVARVSPPNSWDTSGADTIATPWSDAGQVLLMGGFNGAGCDMPSTNRAHHNSCHVRFWPSGTNTINWTRDWPDLQISTSTVMAVEWGSDWTVQNTRIHGYNGGGGIDAAGEYNTADISPVNREHTWVWGTGHTDDEAIGSSGEGVALTIGNDFGVADPADGPESQLAAGIEYGWRNVDFQVWALTHPSLAVDHRFKPDGNRNSTTYNLAVDAASANRMAFITNSSDRNNDNNYPRPIWSARYTANDNIRLERRYSGRNWAAWVQGIDFSAISGGAQTVAADAPPNLVTAGDGYSLLPGETLTVTFSVTIDDPSAVATLVNTVSVTSDGGTLPTVSSATTAVRTLGIPEFTDVDGNAKTPGYSYDITQEQIYLHVYDPDRNTDSLTRESVTVTVTNPLTNDSEAYTLYETGNDTGDFAYAHPKVSSEESNTNPMWWRPSSGISSTRGPG